MSRVAVLGSGIVGRVLADGFLRHGNEVMRGTREPAKLADWLKGAGAMASVGTFAEAARFGELVVLAVKGTAAESALDLAGADALMVNPALPGGPPTRFVCGNSDRAKGEVKAILDRFGWEVEDLGAAEAARAIEPLCILWCIPGFAQNRWTHAFKLLRA